MTTQKRSGRHVQQYRSTTRRNALRRLARATDSATVCYRRDDGLVAVLVGYGATLPARVADADAQLPDGGWLREVVSTPSSVYSDLAGRENPELSPFSAYERKRVDKRGGEGVT